MNPTVKCSFIEGELNYIKWRAKDLVGNGFPETSPINIKVDTTPIEFTFETSPYVVWHRNRIITTKINVHDSGSGVNVDTLEARISISGPWKFTQWMDIEKENITMLDEGNYEIFVTFPYREGYNNYIMFRGMDNAKNPLGESEKINLLVDSMPVHFGEGIPRPNVYSNKPKVECIITIMDEGTGVDADTVEYSISSDGTEEADFGIWMKPLHVIPGNPTQALVEIEYGWGRDNYIRWRANDRIDTGVTISSPFSIWINSQPVITISSPTPSVDYWTGTEILFDASNSYDIDGDNITFYWFSNHSSNYSLGSEAIIRASLPAGKHIITLYVSDGHGYNVSELLFLDVKDVKDSQENQGIMGWFENSVGGGLWLFIGIAIILICLGLSIYYVKIKKKRAEKENKPEIQKEEDSGESVAPSPKKPRSKRGTSHKSKNGKPRSKKRLDTKKGARKPKDSEQHPPPLTPPPKLSSSNNDHERLLQLIAPPSSKKEEDVDNSHDHKSKT